MHIHINHASSGDTNVHYLEIGATCNDCSKPLIFRGVTEMGCDPHKPMVNPDATEIRLPCIGQGEELTGSPTGYRMSIAKEILN